MDVICPKALASEINRTRHTYGSNMSKGISTGDLPIYMSSGIIHLYNLVILSVSLSPQSACVCASDSEVEPMPPAVDTIFRAAPGVMYYSWCVDQSVPTRAYPLEPVPWTGPHRCFVLRCGDSPSNHRA